MPEREFDFDKFCALASFEKIRCLSPDLSSRRLPSMYNPDRKVFYLSSQDVYVDTDDPDQLRFMLEPVRFSYFSAIRSSPINHCNAYLSRVDFIEICRLLLECADDPSEYSDPDSLLAQGHATF